MKRIRKIVLILGCCLIAMSLMLVLFLQLKTKQANIRNIEIVREMESILIHRQKGTIEDTEQSGMPALELFDEDYAALLEIPLYGLKLPVADHWQKMKIYDYPCRLTGTLYNGTLIVGGSDLSGQFDFFDRIEHGTEVKVTDMKGIIYTFEVYRIDRSTSAQISILQDEDSDLTLFVRDERQLEYIIVRCINK